MAAYHFPDFNSSALKLGDRKLGINVEMADLNAGKDTLPEWLGPTEIK